MYIPERWGEGMIVSLFLKSDQEDPNNYIRGITLLNVVGKLFNKVLNYRLLYRLEEYKNYQNLKQVLDLVVLV